MSTTTTNFGWTIPSDTDLVKDGAAAIRTALGGVDTSFVDLKGGTSGQVLSKASGTDLDFTWVAQDDSNAIQNAIVDAKGDLIVGASADTPARLAVGTNGYVLTANSGATNGVEWAAVSGGGWTSLASGSLPASSTLSLSSISGSYNDLRLIIKNAQVASADDAIITVNGGTVVDYLRVMCQGTTVTPQATLGNAANLYININPWATGSNNNTVALDFKNYSATAGWKLVNYSARMYANSQTQMNTGMAVFQTTSAITSIEFKTAGANFSGGSYELWGLK